jgi:aryl-alcohol dehydrogenase-like predicted oxidoreductase
MMTKRKLGKSDLEVSVVGLGCNNFGWRLDLEGTRHVVEKALECGINFFDTADIYGNQGGSEEMLGEVLGKRREEIILATKFGMEMSPTKKGASRRYIMSEVEDSLRRLRTNYIDLYQIHEPDPETPIEETLRALDDLVNQGKVRYVGCSNFSALQLAEAQETSERLGLISFVSCQNEFSLLVRDVKRDLLPEVERRGLGFLPYFPLASGFLTGKYQRGAAMPQGARLSDTTRLSSRYMKGHNWATVEQLRAFAESKGHTLLHLAFAWLLAHPPVSSVIAGATRPEQVEQNVEASHWTLSDMEVAKVDRIINQPVAA